jgi:hypothetical protein
MRTIIVLVLDETSVGRLKARIESGRDDGVAVEKAFPW